MRSASSTTIPSQTGEGGIDSPIELDTPDWRETAKRVVKEIKQDRLAMAAAAMAHYWFLAIFPAIIAAVGFLGLISAGPEALDTMRKSIGSIMPGGATTVLTSAIDSAVKGGRGASVAAAFVGLAIALWSASSATVALQDGLDVVYDVPAERSRKFVAKRLVALGLLIASAVLGGMASVLLVLGGPIGRVLRDALPFGGIVIPVWIAIRFAVAVLALVVLFAVFYFLAPNRESPTWRWISPGGLLAALLWILASLGFSLYVRFASYAKTYGALAGVVVLMLWLFVSALAVLVGGQINAELERQAAMRERRARGRDMPEQNRPEPARMEPVRQPAEAQAARPNRSADPSRAWFDQRRGG